MLYLLDINITSKRMFYFYELAPKGSSQGSLCLPGIHVLSNQCVGERDSFAPEAPEKNGSIVRLNFELP